MKIYSHFLMRGIAPVAIIMLSGWQIEAQTNATFITNAAPIITTNVWKTMTSYREVNGQVFDPAHSVLWKRLNGLAEIKEILPDAVVWQWCENQQSFDSRGWLAAEKRIYGKKFIVRHNSLQIFTAGPDGFEPVGTLKIGSASGMGQQVIYIGTTNYNGEELPVWDCGTPVMSPTIVVITTNYPVQNKIQP
jgi:hypothetical protein